MIQKITKWVVKTKKKTHEFASKEKAVQFESEQEIKAIIEKLSPLLEKYFKTRFNDTMKWSDRFRTFCVDCGKLISHYEEVMDGYDSYPGKELLPDVKCIRFLDGYRCENCQHKAYELFKTILEYIHKRDQTLMWAIYDLSLETTDQLQKSHLFASFLKMLEKWHKNQQRKKK